LGQRLEMAVGQGDINQCIHRIFLQLGYHRAPISECLARQDVYEICGINKFTDGIATGLCSGPQSEHF
jgi:hypothetical protein